MMGKKNIETKTFKELHKAKEKSKRGRLSMTMNINHILGLVVGFIAGIALSVVVFR